MHTEPYLWIDTAEMIIRLTDIRLDGVLKDGTYELFLEEQWIPVYVSIPRVNTSSKPMRVMEISSADTRLGSLLRVYRRVTDESDDLLLRGPAGEVHSVGYSGYGLRDYLHVSGRFLRDKTEGSFPFLCQLSALCSMEGTAGEMERQGNRMLYIKDLTFRETTKLLQALAEREVLLEEIL
ncbi:hypothetical protein [Gorillibacterium sp. sgz5001074]|uniref:hypothetical protein n=1 Tax=Gorillibacterium sp. sgz5001074 TaxID=3446695 RepID=UPI003F677B57